MPCSIGSLRPIAIVGTEQIDLTASVGIAVMRPGDELDLDGLLARADEALASARCAGGNRTRARPEARPDCGSRTMTARGATTR